MEKLGLSLCHAQQLVEGFWKILYIKNLFLLSELFGLDLFFLVDVDNEDFSCFICGEEVLVVGIPCEGSEKFFMGVLPGVELLSA